MFVYGRHAFAVFSAHTIHERTLFRKVPVMCLEYLLAEYGPGCSVWCFLDIFFLLIVYNYIHCLLYTKYISNLMFGALGNTSRHNLFAEWNVHIETCSGQIFDSHH